jgi:uncharacterized sulfatase
MKLNRLLPLFALLVCGPIAAHADLASLFTNVNQNARIGTPRRTSIIFIQCHDLARGDLSCYGQTNYQTPNFDRLARGGIRFTNYSGAGQSAWTTAMLLNGKNSALSPGEANLPQRLQAAGYRTGLIGEWSQPGQPWELGFDEFAGFLEDAEGRNYYADYLWRYAPRAIFHGTNSAPTAFEGKEMIYPNTGGKKQKYIPDVFFDAAVNFVRISQPDAFNHYRPFFLLVNLPAPRSARAGADDFPVPSDAPFTGESWPQAAKNRAALITRLDTDMGRLLEQLDKLKMTNNLAIFFSSSSAPENFADKNMNFLLPPPDFRSTNNPAPALPMMVWWPGVIPAGKVSGQAWSAVDFAPTALEISLQNAPTNFTGHSVLPTLRARHPGGAK